MKKRIFLPQITLYHVRVYEAFTLNCLPCTLLLHLQATMYAFTVFMHTMYTSTVFIRTMYALKRKNAEVFGVFVLLISLISLL